MLSALLTQGQSTMTRYDGHCSTHTGFSLPQVMARGSIFLSGQKEVRSQVVISILIGCLSLLQVSVKFSKEQDLPGSATRLWIQAGPDSFCALRAVDKSVLLLKPEQELSPESVYNLLPNIQQYGYFYHGLNLDDSTVDPCIPQTDLFHNGLYYKPASNAWDGDIANLLRVRAQMSLKNIPCCSFSDHDPHLWPAYRYSFYTVLSEDS
ncbi:Ovostatin homolog [Lemmus lemmus]